jgi:hypothetical protein
MGLESTEPLPEEAVRADALDLLVGLLLADRTVSRAAGEMPSAGYRFFTSSEIGEIVRRIEEVALDGVDVDRIAEQLPATLNTLRDVSRPSMRSRYPDHREWSKIEGGDEIQVLWEEFRQRRSVAVDGIVSARDRDASLLLRDLWLYLRDLGVIRSVSPEAWEITLRHFRMVGKRKEGSGEARDLFQRTIRETVAFSDERLKELLPTLQTLEERERAAAWERRKPERIALRAVVFRQLADALIAHARELRQDPLEKSWRESIAAHERAVSLLSGERLTPMDAADVALQAGSLLAGGRGRWEPFTGRGAGEKEKEMIARILPLLPAEAPSATMREESLYLSATLRRAVKDPGAGSTAREFLEKYPASPLSGEIGVRLGHEALLAGDTGDAVARYRAAAETGDPETSAVARYMLAWVRSQAGDVDGDRDATPVCRSVGTRLRAKVLSLSRPCVERSPGRLDSCRP